MKPSTSAIAFSRSFAGILLSAALAACGGGGGGNNSAAPPPPPPPPPTITLSLTLIAGQDGGAGVADGLGSVARFNQPTALAVDAQGNVFVADTGNCTIREITPAGLVSTLAGSPNLCSADADGAGGAALFMPPQGIAVDSADNVYVAESQTVRKITAAGVVTTLAGVPPPNGVPNTTGGNSDGTGAAARFEYLSSITLAADGNLYATDFNNCTPTPGCPSFNLRKITPAGVVTTIGADTRFGVSNGNGVTADGAGNLYFANSLLGNGVIYKRAPDGTMAALTTPGEMQLPEGIAIGPNNTFYVTDYNNRTVDVLSPNILTPNSGYIVTVLAGTNNVMGSTDGTGAAAQFALPEGIVTDASGNIYVADTLNNTIRKITASGVVTTFAGKALVTGAADGSGTSAQFNDARGIAVDAAGNFYVADYGNAALRKVTPAGAVSTIATTSGATQLPASLATFGTEYCGPQGVALDAMGNVYFSDSCSTIRKITAAGIAGVFAGGQANPGTSDGAGAGAQFASPAGIAFDPSGNLIVADDTLSYTQPNPFGTFTFTNPVTSTIRKISPSAGVSTLAGTTMTGYADGTGAAALFDNPIGVTVDSQGNIYVADGDYVIRKITPSTVVTTYAGVANHDGETDGAASTATFQADKGIAVDASGNVYVVAGATIRKITPAGVVSTIAGDVNQPALILTSPQGVTCVPYGVAVIDAHDLAITCQNAVVKLTFP